MDEEGVDVQLMLPGLPPAADDVEVEIGFIRANHRFTNDFCSKHPHRLKSLIVVSSRAIEASVQEIKTWARAPWAAGIHPNLAEGVPIDHPDLEPIWAAVTKGCLWRITVSPPAIPGTAISGTTRSSAGPPRTRGAR